MAQRKGDRVRFKIETNYNKYTRRYRVVKITETEMAPCGITIMGEFTDRKVAFYVKKSLTKAWNTESEITWRKRRRTIEERTYA